MLKTGNWKITNFYELLKAIVKICKKNSHCRHTVKTKRVQCVVGKLSSCRLQLLRRYFRVLTIFILSSLYIVVWQRPRWISEGESGSRSYVSWVLKNLNPKRDLDPSSRFCSLHSEAALSRVKDRLTDAHATERRSQQSA